MSERREPETPGGAGPRKDCPDEDTLVAFTRAALDEGARAKVEEHLAGCGDCLRLVGMLAAPAKGSGEGTPTRAQRPQARPATAQPRARGDLLGRFLLLERLGGGGMGEVYAAYDPQLERRVALKLLRADFSAAMGEEAHARLVREAQAMARLSHPNVVAVYEVGREEGQTWVAMELVEGQTLKGWLRAAPRSWREVRDVFVAAGRGLAAAHAAGIVHRDFKPDNVLVGKDGRVRVGDFGLANPYHGGPLPEPGREGVAPAEPALITRTGVLMGTPGYLAPEQLTGKPVDARSDQFSFAVSLWEALHGSRPFAAISAPPAPEHWQLPSPPRRVPAWLHRVVARGLAPSPEARYPSLEALLDELSRDPGARWRRVALGASALGLLAVGGAGYRALQPQAEPPCKGAPARMAGTWDVERRRSLAEAFRITGHPSAEDAFSRAASVLDQYSDAWVRMHTETCEATRVRGEQSDEVLSLRMACLDRRLTGLRALTDLLARPDREMVLQAVSAVHALPDLSACADVAALRAPVPPPDAPAVREQVETMRLRLAEAQALVYAGRFPQAEPLAKQVLEAARPLGYRPLEAEVLALLGNIEERLNRFDEAADVLRRGVMAAVAGGDSLTAARAAAILGRVKCQTSDYASVGFWTDLAQASLDRLGGNDRIQAFVHVALACSASEQRKLSEAIEHQKKALALMERALGEYDPTLIPFLNSLSYYHDEFGQLEQALPLVQRSVELAETALGPDHPSTAHALYTLGGRLFRLGRAEESLIALERSVRLFEKSLGPESHSVAYSLVQMELIFSQRGDYARSVEVLERTLAIMEKTAGPENVLVAHGLAQLGGVRVRQGRPQDAMPLLERSLGIMQKVFGPEHSRLAFPTLYQGLALQKLGRPAEARGRLQKAIELLQKADDAAVGTGWEQLGEWHLAAGQPREALTWFERALAHWEKTPGTLDTALVGPLSGLGRVHLALGAPAAALPPLERARGILDKRKLAPEDTAQVRFALAQALWKTGGDREQVRSLALTAREEYSRSPQALQARVVEDWLERNLPRGVTAPTP